MSVSNQAVLSGAQVATILHAEFGPVREWSDTLADMRRGRSSIAGFSLAPFCRMQAKGSGTSKRPLYLQAETEEFIQDLRAVLPTAPPLSLEPQIIAVDDADNRGWRSCKIIH
ncbi:hypothetical protein [Nevskia ramosa]|uniref:hypothetical protein n=1 Tax=Nevskia ramosa TaxID=64002 RepID=UPI0003B5CFFB|nr:hypothetical protein [Nevskia ramosa]